MGRGARPAWRIRGSIRGWPVDPLNMTGHCAVRFATFVLCDLRAPSRVRAPNPPPRTQTKTGPTTPAGPVSFRSWCMMTGNLPPVTHHAFTHHCPIPNSAPRSAPTPPGSTSDTRRPAGPGTGPAGWRASGRCTRRCRRAARWRTGPPSRRAGRWRWAATRTTASAPSDRLQPRPFVDQAGVEQAGIDGLGAGRQRAFDDQVVQVGRRDDGQLDLDRVADLRPPDRLVRRLAGQRVHQAVLLRHHHAAVHGLQARPPAGSTPGRRV